MTTPRHLVLVESYDGILELVWADSGERAAAGALGLPVAEIAQALGARITVLTWDDWLRYESAPGSFFDWMPFPATRAVRPPGPVPSRTDSAGVRYRAIPANDPDHGEPLVQRGPSPLTYGLLAESDPLFLLSYSLHQFLERLLVEDPFQAVVLPMWGGAGYQAQMIRATGDSRLCEVGFVTVVTGESKERQQRNGEGLWTRPAITRRQMEDVSLGLADQVLAFGPRGAAIARRGRLAPPSEAITAPRFVAPESLERIRVVSEADRPGERIQCYLQEPLDASSGVLTALDAAARLRSDGVALANPIACGGPPIRFAPMKPREFSAYWSSRGFVRELMQKGYWKWDADGAAPNDSLSIRLYPSHFEHLPSAWLSLAAGSLPVLSPAAMEGCGVDLPPEIALGDDISPERVAAVVQDLSSRNARELNQLRREVGCRFVSNLQSPERKRMLDGTVEALDRLLARKPARQALDRVARMFLDRTKPLGEASESNDAIPAAPRPTLSVVVVCYNMGPLITETMDSVWRSERIPDQVILVDDGSSEPDTLTRLEAIEQDSRTRGLPLQVIRQGNRGLAGARNAGLAQATGDFISFLDGDDLIEPAFYRLALALAAEYPRLGGVAAWALCFDEGGPVGFWNAPQPELPLLLVENTVIVPCLVRTSLLRQLGGYDESQRYNYEDWELGVRLLAEGYPIVTIPRYLERYRTRADSLYRTMSEVQNQGMRETMFARHRETVARFSVEVAMQLEHRLMRRVYTSPADTIKVEAKRIARNLRDVFTSVARRLRPGS
jgi:glycosyltransferase involved in cell wall biosynthesis